MAEKRKLKKFSMIDRIRYYRDKREKTKDGKKYAEITGVLDSLTNETYDASMFKTQAEKDSYFKGVKKGYKTFCKSREIKF